MLWVYFVAGVDIMVVYAQIRCNQLGRAVRALMESGSASQSSLLPASVSKEQLHVAE